MKIRHGFVSNSSSSSFVIKRDRLTALQRYAIIHHGQVGQEMGLLYADTDAWSITITPYEIRGWTSMTNFDMQEFFDRIEIPADIVDWDSDHGDY